MNFGAFDTNTTSSNYYVGRSVPENSSTDPEWHAYAIELPPDSVEVPPLDISFRDFMDNKINPRRPIPPLESRDMGLKLHSVPMKDVSTVTEEEYTGLSAATPSVQSPPPVSPPPHHSPTIPQHQGQAAQMETEQDVFKRQLSGEAQVAVVQPPRPTMPNI